MYLAVSVVFLLNLLVTQFSSAYDVIYADMVGYACLERIRIITAIVRVFYYLFLIVIVIVFAVFAVGINICAPVTACFQCSRWFSSCWGASS